MFKQSRRFLIANQSECHSAEIECMSFYLFYNSTDQLRSQIIKEIEEKHIQLLSKNEIKASRHVDTFCG